MNAQDLINQYKQAVADQEAARSKQKAENIDAARVRFDTNCRIWLGELWDEFQPGDVKSVEQSGYSYLSVQFSLPISFMGFKGNLEALYSQGHNWQRCRIDFGQINLGQYGPFANMSLTTDADGKATPANPRELGALLALLEEGAPIRDERMRRYEETQRAEALEFHGNYIPHIQSEMERRITLFPDLEAQIREAAQAAIQTIETAERARQEENQHYVDVQVEQTNLRTLAAITWKKPFTLFKVEYGAFVDTDGDTITRSFYTFQDAPFEDGYWVALESGKPSRRIKPSHVLSIEELMVTSEDQAPYEAKRFIELTSKTVEGASAMVWLPPVEVFAFDIESITTEEAAA